MLPSSVRLVENIAKYCSHLKKITFYNLASAAEEENVSNKNDSFATIYKKQLPFCIKHTFRSVYANSLTGLTY